MTDQTPPTVWIRGTEPNYPRIAGAATFHVEALVKALDEGLATLRQVPAAEPDDLRRLARSLQHVHLAAKDWLRERQREQAAHDASLLR